MKEYLLRKQYSLVQTIAMLAFGVLVNHGLGFEGAMLLIIVAILHP